MDISKYGKHSSAILIYLLEKGEIPITAFANIQIGPTSYYRSLALLQADGLVKRREIIKRRKFVLFSLTDKGREVAEKLKQAQDVAEGIIHIDGEDINVNPTPEVRVNSKRLKFLFHFNVMDNHITLEEVEPGKSSHLFNIYIKQNSHGGFVLWCEADNSYDCWHVHEALTYPQVQKMMMRYKGKTKICPSCGYENPEEAVYCMKCATKLN